MLLQDDNPVSGNEFLNIVAIRAVPSNNCLNYFPQAATPYTTDFSLLFLKVRRCIAPRNLRWDETAETVGLDADHSGVAVKSAWQLMVTRVTIYIVFAGFATLELQVAPHS